MNPPRQALRPGPHPPAPTQNLPGFAQPPTNRLRHFFRLALAFTLALTFLRPPAAATAATPATPTSRSLRFTATTPDAARAWQQTARTKLYELMMGGRTPAKPALDPKIHLRQPGPGGSYALEQVSFQTLPGRRLHVWLALPSAPRGKVGAVLAFHGHGSRPEPLLRGDDRFWYGRALAEMGYVVVAPDLSDHRPSYPGWSLMGERAWNAIRCLDYLATLGYVDTNRLAAVGLELGGLTALLVSALDDRLPLTIASATLTTLPNLQQGHCPCWKIPGLEGYFELSDIAACVAPRRLLFEHGQLDQAPGGFPANLAQQAFAELHPAFALLDAPTHARLILHDQGQTFRGYEAWGVLREALGRAAPWQRISPPTATDELLRRGDIARRCFIRATGVLESWWRHRDPATGLFPRQTHERVWAPGDNGGQLFPYLLATAELLQPHRTPDLLQTLRTERTLASWGGFLTDWFDLTNRTFLFPQPDLPRQLAGAAELAADGLLPLAELLGRGEWTPRLAEIADTIINDAPIASDFGPLPFDDLPHNGRMMQLLARLYTLTREPRYLDLATRLGDAYAREVLPRSGFLPPHRWDFQRHAPLDDEWDLHAHGFYLLNGLAEIYTVTARSLPQRAQSWQPALNSLFLRLTQQASPNAGFPVHAARASTGDVRSTAPTASWGHALAACLAYARATTNETFLEAPRLALRNLNQPRYLDWSGAITHATTLDGALLLLNRLPEPAAWTWFEDLLPLFLARSRPDGSIEGWYGDGLYARTALLAGQYYTQGAHCRPWRADLRLGALREGNRLRLALAADTDWEGRILFDTPRHRTHLRLPSNYPRLGEFPEWYPVSADTPYRVRLGGTTRQGLGYELAQGLPVSVRPNQPLLLEIEPR